MKYCDAQQVHARDGVTAISFAHECDPDTYGLFAVGGTNGVVSVYDFDEVSKAIKQSLSELFFSFSVYDFQFVSKFPSTHLVHFITRLLTSDTNHQNKLNTNL